MHLVLPEGVIAPCRRAGSFGRRLRGLLGTRPGDLAGGCILLDPCSSVHTLGMAYPIDVAFLDGDDAVMGSFANVGPGRLVGMRGAARVLERESAASPWYAVGDHVVFFTW